jgi:hypothetical protein
MKIDCTVFIFSDHILNPNDELKKSIHYPEENIRVPGTVHDNLVHRKMAAK